MGLTQHQDLVISVSMRVAGGISLLGCVFIVSTFALSRRFRRPVNRLIFFASWGNLALAICGILSVDPMRAPYGPGSSMCTAQGFMVQMFLPSDALWNLAMAINVYLTIFRRWEVDRMKRLEPIYAGVNFGGPMLVAIIYLFINNPTRGKIYGPASIWCWITPEWDALRIALLYAPSWLCILCIFGIYVAAGNFIYQKRKGLNSARVTPPSFKRSSWVPLRDSPGDKAPDVFTATKTTQIKITTEPSASHSDYELNDLAGTNTNQDSDSVDGLSKRGAPAGLSQRPYEPYSVTINAGGKNTARSQDPDIEEAVDEDDWDLRNPGLPRRPSLSMRKSGFDHASTYSRPPMPAHDRSGNASRRATLAAQRQQTHLAWNYTKVALLYFLSLLSTWVPSSVNRLFSLANENDVNFGLSLAAAIVLPLVGFWNALIYIVTSWDAIRELFWEGADWTSRRVARFTRK